VNRSPGEIVDIVSDWPTLLKDEPDIDDDEFPEKTPEDVVGMLGFDPDDYDDDGDPVRTTGKRKARNEAAKGKPKQ
jgi:hypothetical protein